MPWTKADVDEHKAGLTDEEENLWVEVANDRLASCLDDGGEQDECEASAIKQANAVVSKQEEEREVTMERNILQQLLDGIKRLFDPLLRAWDGSASNYASTDAYCSACLLDLNAAAGNDEKAQSHCMLPVKSPGSDSYNQDGVHAAAARFGQVKKPSDVDQAAWDSAVKSAANKLISAYNSFDETAPDSLYEAAGKEPPESERALALGRLFAQVDDQLWNMEGWPWLHDIYQDNGSSFFAIISERGKLYQVPLAVADGSVTMGEWREVEEQFTPIVPATRTIVRQQADGRYRWISISATAVLNRVGEIDSRALFDSFIAHAKETGEYPTRQFYHTGIEIGQADYLARDEYVYVTSGLFYDAPLAVACARAHAEDIEWWGESIGYTPTSQPTMVEIAPDVTVPVYTSGIHREISTLPEQRAASWFTISRIQEVDRMRDEIREALERLKEHGLTDEDITAFAGILDGTNREIGDANLVTRKKGGEQGPEPVTEPAPETETEPVAREVELDETAFEAIAARFAEMLAPLTEKLDGLSVTVGELSQAQETATDEAKRSRDSLNVRMKALERSDEEKQHEWMADVPRRDQLKVTYRPRAAHAPDADTPVSLADVAANTLENMPRY